MTWQPPQLLIDGELRPASGGSTYPILNPATGVEIGQAPDATAADVDAAIAAARRAFDETDWSTNHELRVDCLRRLHQALVDNAEEARRYLQKFVDVAGADTPAHYTQAAQSRIAALGGGS